MNWRVPSAIVLGFFLALFGGCAWVMFRMEDDPPPPLSDGEWDRIEDRKGGAD